jgi:hypothetical protein
VFDFLAEIVKFSKFNYILVIKYLKKMDWEEGFYTLLIENLKDSNVMIRSMILSTKKIALENGLEEATLSNAEYWKPDRREQSPAKTNKELFKLSILNDIRLEKSVSLKA